MAEFAIWAADLEIRQTGGAHVLAGRFPYNKLATVRSRGARRKERFGSDAFGWQIRRFQELQAELADTIGGAIERVQREAIEQELARRNTHVLVGHDFNRPLGDRLSRTARVESTADAVTFAVDLPDEADMPTYMLDLVKQVRTGRAGGVSPGFQVPPATVVRDAERLVPEPGNPGVLIRQIDQAVLPELSIVTRPAYTGTALDLRADDFGEPADADTRPRAATLWL